MKYILSKPLDQMTGQELEKVIMGIELVISGGVTESMAIVLSMIVECVEVELASRD